MANANNLYTASGNPAAGSVGRSAPLRAEFALIEEGFKKVSVFGLQMYFADFNTAGDIYASWFNEISGLCTRVSAVNHVANTTAATVLTAYSTSSLAMTHPTWEFGATDAAGTRISAAPTDDNQINKTTVVRVNSDGGGGSVMPGHVLFEVTLD